MLNGTLTLMHDSPMDPECTEPCSSPTFMDHVHQAMKCAEFESSRSFAFGDQKMPIISADGSCPLENTPTRPVDSRSIESQARRIQDDGHRLRPGWIREGRSILLNSWKPPGFPWTALVWLYFDWMPSSMCPGNVASVRWFWISRRACGPAGKRRKVVLS
jgi:hypothetical protein